MLFTCLLNLLSYTIQDHLPSDGNSTSENWALSHQSLIQKFAPQICFLPSVQRHFLRIPSSQMCLDSIGDPFFPRTTQILLEYQLGRWVPRLREPRDLYGVSSSGPLSPTRWPYHCEVIDEKVQHIGMFLEVLEIQNQQTYLINLDINEKTNDVNSCITEV